MNDKLKQKCAARCEKRIERALLREARDKDINREEAEEEEAIDLSYGMDLTLAERKKESCIRGLDHLAESNCSKRIERALRAAEKNK